MTSNPKLMVLRTQAAKRKGSTGLDTNYHSIETRLTVALKYTNSWGKWNMWKLILSFVPSENEFTSILGRRSSNIQIDTVTTYRKPSLCDLMKFWWWICCVRCVYDFQKTNEAVRGCVLPSTTHIFKPQRLELFACITVPPTGRRNRW